MKGKNACHYAAESGSIDILKLFESNNFDIEAITDHGHNIFHIACIHDKLELCQFIAKEYRNMIFAESHEKWNAILFAAKHGYVDILNFLHEQEVCFEQKSESDRNALHIACDNGHLSACKFIIKVCPSLLRIADYKGRHAGHFAARNGNVDIMKYLVSIKAEVTKNTNTAMNILHMACLHCRKEMCRYLLHTFPAMNLQRSARGWTTLHFVAEKGINEGNEIEIFEMLIGMKDSLEIKALTKQNNSVLTLAMKNKLYDFCEYLLREHSYLLDIPNAINPMEMKTLDTKMKKLLMKYRKS
ncbi:receptor-interacting serine/threonine-protein kinase 4-like [Saccostrea cucullata]|uniref:receptor-interacting serine/threonine-protein kinase 4-like n=1 Tax=Saccostrea cuccullata TaxID=36930 RepID=UPI002ED64FFF